MRSLRRGGGKEFIDNEGCRESPRYLTIAENGNEKGGTPREREKKTVLRDPKCQRHGGLAKQKGRRPRNKPET
jgi:hypothetical protein